MSLGQRENREPRIGAGGRVFITPLYLYIVICYVLLGWKTWPKGSVCSWHLLHPARDAYRWQSMYLIHPYSGATVLCLALKLACKESEVDIPILPVCHP